jgi:hypothetical protein
LIILGDIGCLVGLAEKGKTSASIAMLQFVDPALNIQQSKQTTRHLLLLLGFPDLFIGSCGICVRSRRIGIGLLPGSVGENLFSFD